MTDIASMRSVPKGDDPLLLLNAAVPDETNQALGTLDIARAAGTQRIVYFSVLNSASSTACRISQQSTSSNGSSQKDLTSQAVVGRAG